MGGLAKFYLGETYFEMGKYQPSQDYYNKSVYVLKSHQILPSFINLNKIAAVRAKVMNDEKDIDLESLYSYATDIKIKWYEGWTARYISEILLNIDDQHMSEAEDWMVKAIEADKKNGMMFNLGRDHLSYAELLKRKGNIPKVRENPSQVENSDNGVEGGPLFFTDLDRHYMWYLVRLGKKFQYLATIDGYQNRE